MASWGRRLEGAGTFFSHPSFFKDTGCHHHRNKKVTFYKGVYVCRPCSSIYHL